MAGAEIAKTLSTNNNAIFDHLNTFPSPDF
jgi:hypothetical protein